MIKNLCCLKKVTLLNYITIIINRHHMFLSPVLFWTASLLLRYREVQVETFHQGDLILQTLYIYYQGNILGQKYFREMIVWIITQRRHNFRQHFSQNLPRWTAHQGEESLIDICLIRCPANCSICTCMAHVWYTQLQFIAASGFCLPSVVLLAFSSSSCLAAKKPPLEPPIKLLLADSLHIGQKLIQFTLP